MNKYPLGSWKESAINIVYNSIDSTLECNLRKINGTYVYNKIVVDKNNIYENCDGNFKIIRKFVNTFDYPIPEGNWIESAINIKIDKEELDNEIKKEQVETKLVEEEKVEAKLIETELVETELVETELVEQVEAKLVEEEKVETKLVEEEQVETKLVEQEKVETKLVEEEKVQEIYYIISFELINKKNVLHKIKYCEGDKIKIIDGNTFLIKNNDNLILDSIKPIPKKIFQTHKNFNFIINNEKTKKSYKSWNQFKDFEYNFYNDEECEEFIKNNFEENIYQAYMKCPIAVMKADLWRYCIIYKYGGIYADSDSICLKDPSLFLEKSSYLVCIPENDKMHMCNWVFAAPEASPVLKSVIELCVERILNNFEKKQHMVHYYTGPRVFIDGIELYLKQNNLITFNDKTLYSLAYKNYWLHVFDDFNNFNNNTVRHLEAGKDENGWKKKIKEYINSK